MPPTIRTFGELKASGYLPRSVREEVRENLLRALHSGETLFPGIIGYDDSVVPQLVNALLSRHDVLLLGLRGQAKTRLLRAITRFLDEWTPMVAGSPLNESPFHPLLAPTKERLRAEGDSTPIAWIHRDQRFQEKLATPDVSMADLIGDIDPIRASRDRLDLSDERVIHFGIVPRTNRGIFLLNELPDLPARIQVGLLNILEEKDVQIRGFPVRLELDMLLLFTANPEDYTNRGKIITPLKDRIGSQILTHYPRTLDEGIAITTQEADTVRSCEVVVPRLYQEVVEEIAREARKSEHIDQSSGVSVRLTVSALELLVSNVERRAVRHAEKTPRPRLCDLFALLPAITGKCELVFEGEQEGAAIVASRLIGQAIKTVFARHFAPVHHSRKDPAPPEPLYARIQGWFSAGRTLELTDSTPAAEASKSLRKVDGLRELVQKYLPGLPPEEELGAMELALEALHQHSVLSREGAIGPVTYGDMLSRMMEDL